MTVAGSAASACRGRRSLARCSSPPRSSSTTAFPPGSRGVRPGLSARHIDNPGAWPRVRSLHLCKRAFRARSAADAVASAINHLAVRSRQHPPCTLAASCDCPLPACFSWLPPPRAVRSPSTAPSDAAPDRILEGVTVSALDGAPAAGLSVQVGTCTSGHDRRGRPLHRGDQQPGRLHRGRQSAPSSWNGARWSPARPACRRGCR